MTAALHTTRQVADALGISVQRVKQLAVALGVGQKVGRDWVFTDDALTILKGRNTVQGRPVSTKVSTESGKRSMIT